MLTQNIKSLLYESIANIDDVKFCLLLKKLWIENIIYLPSQYYRRIK